jgi:DNA-binding transcriptional LysR family regulator
MTEDYNLYPLHVFRVVARRGSVTRAAEELCISQPAVSSHLKTLQSRYKETLLERTPRGMLLTPAGAVVAEHANRVFALLEDAAAAVEATRGEVKGHVTLAASSTPGAYLVPRLLRRFQDHYPDATATLLVGDSAEVLSWLRDYRVALGVVGETEREDGLIREEIAQDELRLVTAATDGLCQREEIKQEHLSGRTLFLREPGSSTRAGAEALLCGWMGGFARVVELRSTEAIKQAVIAGLGVAVLSSWAMELEETAGLLSSVRDTRFRHERKFYIVRRADRSLVGTVAALWNCLVACSRVSGAGECLA